MVSPTHNPTHKVGRISTGTNYATKENFLATVVYVEKRIARFEKEFRTYHTGESMSTILQPERMTMTGKETNQIRATGRYAVEPSHDGVRNLYAEAGPTASLAVAAIGVLMSTGLLAAGRLELLIASVFLTVAFSTLGALQWHVQQRLNLRGGRQSG